MTNLTQSPQLRPHLYRIKEVLELIPISRSAWIKGVDAGKFPASIKLGPKIRVWRSKDIHNFLESL
jgi:predicted DNA-binding transcriptional regulator AlpA